MLAPIALAILITPTAAQEKTPPDGVYQVHEKGDGPKVTRNDTGASMHLGQRLTDKLGTATIRSESNDNSRFRFELQGVGTYPKDAQPAPGAILINGKCYMIYSQSDPNDGPGNLGAQIHGEDAMREVAKRLKIEPTLRKHPGHKVLVRFTPDKETYKPREPISLTMTIKNVGENTVTFFDGGRQRGPRDNQFGFTAYRGHGSGLAVPDSGDPTNFGGLGSNRTLKPGESFKKDVRLDKWFVFNDADTYLVTGTYRLEIHDPNVKGYRVIWNDFAVGECLIRVAEAK